jgi:hypothetical protein
MHLPVEPTLDDDQTCAVAMRRRIVSRLTWSFRAA